MAPRAYTPRVVDPADDPDKLAEALGELAARGYVIECPALDGQMRRQRRDEYLRQALALLTGTPWGRCAALEKEIAQFESILWPRLRDRETPPEECSALRRHLFEARRLGPLPSTGRQIRNIIAKCADRGDFAEKPL